MLRTATAFCAALLAGSANASITVSSYAMPDGANLYGAYYDNAYTGTKDLSGFLSGGKGDLTDGVLSVSVAAGYGAWLPYVLWDGQSPVITFDLGGVFALTGITSYFKYYPQAAVYLPANIGLRFSLDGLSYGADQTRTFSPAERLPGGDDSDGIEALLLAPANARFVEVTLNNGPEDRWLALSEVVFDGAASSVVTGGAVPEPGTAALALVSLLGLGLQRLRQR